MKYESKEIPTINTFTSEIIKSICCSCKNGYVNTAQFRIFCIIGMDVTDGLKVKEDWKFIVRKILNKKAILQYNVFI